MAAWWDKNYSGGGDGVVCALGLGKQYLAVCDYGGFVLGLGKFYFDADFIAAFWDKNQIGDETVLWEKLAVYWEKRLLYTEPWGWCRELESKYRLENRHGCQWKTPIVHHNMEFDWDRE